MTEPTPKPVQLSPCPKCGAPAVLVPGQRHTPGGVMRWSIHCSRKCGQEVIKDWDGEVIRKWAALSG